MKTEWTLINSASLPLSMKGNDYKVASNLNTKGRNKIDKMYVKKSTTVHTIRDLRTEKFLLHGLFLSAT